MKQHKFGDIDLSDPFFDSLKEDYPEFTEWYTKKTKSDTKAFCPKRSRWKTSRLPIYEA